MNDIEFISHVADEYDITPELARNLLLYYSSDLDQPAQPAPPEEREPPEAPPARKVNPWWYFTGIEQATEKITWPVAALFMGYSGFKGGMAASAGLPWRAAAPKRLGGMSPRELKAANQSTRYAMKMARWYGTPRAQRPKAFPLGRPKVPKVVRARPKTLRIPGIPPRTLGVGSWMPAAGMFASALAAGAACPEGQVWCAVTNQCLTEEVCKELERTGGFL